METPLTITLVKTEQKMAAARTLALAFTHDPLMQFAIPDAAARPGILAWLFGTVVHYCILYGTVYATPALDGVACWLPPGKTTLTPVGIARAGMMAMGFKLGRSAAWRFLANLRYTDHLHGQLIPAPHWYLWAIGVDPACQGQGIGKKLVAHGLENPDKEAMPCYLETHNPKNVAFYRKFGFKVASDGVIPKRDLRVWAMVRQPSPSATCRRGTETPLQ